MSIRSAGYGGVGDDFLEGGAGEDIYVFGGRWGTDTIRGETANTNGGKLYFKDATSSAASVLAEHVFGVPPKRRAALQEIIDR